MGLILGTLPRWGNDFGGIVIKKNANVQDSCIIHGFPDYVTVVEEFGHVGHGAILHGYRVGKNALIGMNSVILDMESEIGENSIIGANSSTMLSKIQNSAKCFVSRKSC